MHKSELNTKKTVILKIGSVLFWILVWGAIALIINQKLILAGPIDVAQTFYATVVQPKFWATVGISFLHIFIGFIVAEIIGSIAGIAAGHSNAFQIFINPIMQLFKSAPVVCLIVLLLIWFGSDYVDFAAVIISVTPVFYFAMEAAVTQRNSEIINMLDVFKVSRADKFCAYIWPSSLPYFKQATSTGIGIAWKAGVTAQTIGAVSLTIGEGIYNSKINLDSAQLIVWMIVVILLSAACEQIIRLVLKGSSHSSRLKISENRVYKIAEKKTDVRLEKISVAYENKTVLDNFSAEFKAGKRYAILGPTGCGKSTLLSEIIKNADSPKQRVFSVEFQATTLVPYLTIAENLALVGAKPASSQDISILPNTTLMPDELSGGMKRCAELVRAIEADSAIVMLDEPFAGLDPQTKQDAICYIKNNLRNRTLIIVTHDKQDAEDLHCDSVNIK